jgi:hypothetical protein
MDESKLFLTSWPALVLVSWIAIEDSEATTPRPSLPDD